MLPASRPRTGGEGGVANLDIPVWLQNLGLEKYQEAFRDNAVEGDVLFDLTEGDLERLGVLLGHRKKMLNSIASLRAGRDQFAARVQDPRSALADVEGERRQVTILFADLAGFTALSNELDSEDVHRILGRFFALADRIIADHGGHVDKHIGDSVMAVFGAPIAHDNDEERAVRSALAIRSAMPALAAESGRVLQVHVGIAAGEVVASGTGSETHREYTVTGDTVNLAARLTGEAGAGEILASDRVWRALGAKLEGAESGALAVKGFAEAVKAYRLHGFRRVAHGDSAPIVGRLRELGQFRTALASCRETGQGGAIYVRGEAGIGKTRLIKEFEREAAAAGFACDLGAVIDFGAGVDAIRILVRSALGVASAAVVEAREAAVAAAVQGGLIGAEHIVFLNDLLDLPQPPALRSLYEAMDHAARRQGNQRLLGRLIKSVCERQPRLLMVEDVHWADAPTWSYLAALTRAVAECPAILVMTSRPERDLADARWRAEIAGASLLTMDLGPLRREDALALAHAVVGASAPLAERLVDRAEGNPLFLEQLLRHAQEGSQSAVPGSVRAIVQARVDRLDPGNRRALQAASVLGQSFSLAALRHVLGAPEFDCSELISYAVLRSTGEYCQFAHALIKDAIYASLLRAKRRELHQSAAVWCATRDVSLWAEHLDRADDPQAPAAYAAAAEAQAGLLRLERALQLAERGRALAASPDDVIRLGLLRAGILRELGRVQEALQAFREVALTAADAMARCRAWIGVASCVRLLGGNEEGVAALKTAEPLARELKADRELSDIHYYFGSLMFASGDIDGCYRHHGEARDFALKAQAPECEARALSGLGDAHYGRGRMRLAIDHFRRCKALCQEHGLARVEVGSTHMIGAIRRYLFEWEEAIEDLREAAGIAVKVGNIRTQMVALNILGEILVDAARPDEARAALGEALGLAETFDNPRYRAYVLYELGRAHYYDPTHRREAEATLEEALALSRRTEMRFIGPRVLAALALASDQRRAAALAEGEAVLKGGCLAHNALWFYRDAIEAGLIACDFDRVRNYASALANFAGGEALPWSQFFVDRGRALAEYAGGGRGPALFDDFIRLKGEAQRSGLKASMLEIEAILAENAMD